jgi:hypothetical protein
MVKHFTRSLIVFVAFLITSLNVTAQISLNTLNGTYSQNFNTLASTGSTNDVSTLPQGWTFLETGTNANTTYAAGTGSSNAGNTYSLGLDADRALGGLRSGSLIPVLGASFVNNTGAVITTLQISYTGEQWRLGATPRVSADKLDFQYSLDAASLSTGAWTDVNDLDFSAPLISGTVGALNGNTNRAMPTAIITGLAIAPGTTFWIRWNDLDVSGADDALAVDDFSITPNGVSSHQPNITFTPSSLNFGTVNTGASRVLTYSFDGSNLDHGLTFVSENNSVFALSTDGVNFTDSLAVGDSTTVYVRFTPAADGNVTDSILHQNGSFHKSLLVQGVGYDPIANIIPIATARTKTAGTRVTVAGRVTVGNEFAGPSQIQDNTGGIAVFASGVSSHVAIGDSVIVTGPISLFNQMVEISGSGVTFSFADSSTRVVAPRNIQVTELAANEGLLVTVQNVELVNKAFVFYPNSTEQLTNGSTQIDLRIDGDTNIPGLTKPQSVVNITGIVGRFNANAQLMPRFSNDIPDAVVPETPADSIPKSTTFDVMNWNLEFFGAQREDYPDEFGPADEPLQRDNVAKVILNQGPDIVAVQEVSNNTFFTQLVSELPGYASICSPRYSHDFDDDGTFPPQKVCYIYDTTTVKVISYRPMFVQLFDQARTGYPELLPGIPGGDPSGFFASGRLPFLLTADVTINGVTERISFIDIHAKSGGDEGSRVRRGYDMQVLKDSLDAHFNHEKFVILGDLNDDLDQSIVVGQPTPYAAYVADSSNYVPITKALSDADARSTVSFNDVIDHQVLSNELGALYIQGSVRIFAPFSLIPNYANTTSDHLPVLSRFEFALPVISFATTTATIDEGDSITVQLDLDRAFDTDQTVNIIGDSTDIIIGSAHFAAGNTSGSAMFIAIDDSEEESAETFTLSIAPSSAYNPGNNSQFTLTIIDNDRPSISFEETEVSVAEGSGKYNVKLRLSKALSSSRSVVISLLNSDSLFYGEDYHAEPAPRPDGNILLTIPANKTEVSFGIMPKKDRLREGEETVTFTISSAASGINIGDPSTLNVHVIDVTPCLPLFVVNPNPTNGPINIWTPANNEDSIVNGALFDPQGNVLRTLDGTVKEIAEEFTKTMHGRREGIYIMKLTQCNQAFTVRLLKR